MNRRAFLGIAGGLALSAPLVARARSIALRELRITRILVQDALGRRLTPVAPNAYAPFRGYEVKEPVLRIFAGNRLEGICHNPVKPELLQKLIGLDPFALFEWTGDVIKGPAEPHRQLLADLRGADIALFEWDPLESTCRHASLSIL